MINQNELKRFNYVERYYRPLQIHSIADNKITTNEGDFMPMELDGIPITKELLVDKCGFAMRGDLECPVFLFLNDIGFYFRDYTFICFKDCYIDLKHIKYLHQLQNLIYSLTGNEMPIKM